MKKLLAAACIASTVALSAGAAMAGGARLSCSSVNVQVNGYLPAPPGVNIQIDAGRPYYVEGTRRVYMEKEPARRDNRRPYKKEKKHHKDNGHKYGHYKEEHGGNGGRGGHGH